MADFEKMKLQLKRLRGEQEQLGEHLAREMKAIIAAEEVEKSAPDSAKTCENTRSEPVLPWFRMRFMRLAWPEACRRRSRAPA